MQNPKLEADTGSRERNYKNVWEKLEKAKMTTVTFNYSKDTEPLAVVGREAGADGESLPRGSPVCRCRAFCSQVVHIQLVI